MATEDDVVATAIAADVELSNRAKRIAEKMLGRVEHIVNAGNDQAVLAIAAKVMPALMKAIGTRGDDDARMQMFNDMRVEMREYGAAAVEQVPDVIEDEAPAVPARRSVKPPEIRVSTLAMRDREKPGKKSARRSTPGADEPEDAS